MLYIGVGGVSSSRYRTTLQTQGTTGKMGTDTRPALLSFSVTPPDGLELLSLKAIAIKACRDGKLFSYHFRTSAIC